jgi:hypothetical protein
MMNPDAAWDLCLALKEMGLISQTDHMEIRSVLLQEPLLINKEQILQIQ